MIDKLEILEESKRRVRAIARGAPVTNICASVQNPCHHAYFVEYKVRTTTRKGFKHNHYLARYTDQKGKFWNGDINVIYPGHLDQEKCKELFKPVWESEYGDNQS